MRNPILKVNSSNSPLSAPQKEIASTQSNSPSYLRLNTKMQISYKSMVDNLPKTAVQVGDILTNERNRLRSEIGEMEFVTELNPTQRGLDSMKFARKGANCHVIHVEDDSTNSDLSFYNIYVNQVDGYNSGSSGNLTQYSPFTKDDIILISGNNLSGASSTTISTNTDQIADIKTISGPEANTYSGEILYVENVSPITRVSGQTEDIKIILDF